MHKIAEAAGRYLEVKENETISDNIGQNLLKNSTADDVFLGIKVWSG